ncbi:MAG: hypothetical protein WCP28_19695, partial [Actinomycetes bacterium]
SGTLIPESELPIRTRAPRTVRQADGLDPVRALQRVLYRSAKQDRTRRFHALFDKLARSDGVWTVLEQTTTRPDGTYSFTVGPFTTHTTYLYRVVALADSLHTEGTSNDLVVNVY